MNEFVVYSSDKNIIMAFIYYQGYNFINLITELGDDGSGSGTANAVDDGADTDVMEDDVQPAQPTLEQRLEFASKASRSAILTNVCQQSDTERRMLSAIKAEMAVFANSGHRGPLLQQAYDHLITIPPTSVEAERAFSAAGLICNKLRSRLGDATVDTLAFLKAYYRDTVLPVL
jgi:hypothetical protein